MLNALIANEPTTVDVLEQTTPRYSAVLTDDQGVAIPAASLSTLTLFLYVIQSDGSIHYIRGAANAPQNVLNANNVTVDGSGNLSWAIQTTDTTLVEALPFERHIALWTWTTATITGRHELHLTVKNLSAI